jgi:hypothetical protein
MYETWDSEASYRGGLSGAKGKAEKRQAAGLPPLQKQVDAGIVDQFGDWLGKIFKGSNQPDVLPVDGAPAQPGTATGAPGGLLDGLPSWALPVGAGLLLLFFLKKK